MKKMIWGFFCVCCLLAESLPAQAGGREMAGISLTASQEPFDAAGTATGEAREEASAELDLYATAAVLMDADSGRVLYGKNEDAVMAMASTTKIMTCILILENTSPEEELTVSAYAASMPKVKLSIQKGERYQVRDLLHSLMLESHNDAAVALAEHVGKRFLPAKLRDKDTADYTVEESRLAVAAFAALMNGKASELGCKDTWFITPNGLDAAEDVVLQDGTSVERQHCTTARELAAILSYCIRQSPRREEFLDITRAQDYSFYANGRSFSCVNHNAFLNMMEGALTGKTGFTNKAGYCYVGALEQDGRTFVVALLACGWPNNKTYKWSDTRSLMQYGIDNYHYRSFLEEGTAFDESRLRPIPVRNGQTDVLGLTAFANVEIAGRQETDGLSGGQPSLEEGLFRENRIAVLGGAPDREGLLLRQDEEVQVEYSIMDSLTAPVEGGAMVGTVDYIVDGVVYRREAIVTSDAVEAIDPAWCLRQILWRFLCL